LIEFLQPFHAFDFLPKLRQGLDDICNMKKMLPVGSYFGRARVFGYILAGIILFSLIYFLLEFLQG